MKLRWDRFQILTIASTAGAFALMVAGGFVTQTSSGLGCPDWPLCHGKVVPDFSNPNTAIEWTHRTVAAIVGVLVLLMTFFAWRDRKGEKRIVRTATLSLVLVIVQAGLGGATVLSELNPAIVVVHLSMAAAFFATTVATMVLAFVLPRPAPVTPTEASESPSRISENGPQ